VPHGDWRRGGRGGCPLLLSGFRKGQTGAVRAVQGADSSFMGICKQGVIGFQEMGDMSGEVGVHGGINW
jgi:hypothetical protein